MTSDEIIGFKKSSKINGLKLDVTCRTPNSYFKRRVLIQCEKFEDLIRQVRTPPVRPADGVEGCVYESFVPGKLVVVWGCGR